MISDERIERAARAVAITNCGQAKFDECTKNKDQCVCRSEVRIALTTAAERLRVYRTPPDINALARDLNKAGEAEYGKPPEIAAAEIRGLEMAKEIANRRTIRNDCCFKREDEAAQIADDILARIAELKTKTEPVK